MLNEKGDVVDFRLTVGQSLKDDSVNEMLYDLKKVSANINLIMTDNCCQCRQLLQEIFDDKEVKLDLWHGVNRLNTYSSEKECRKRPMI